MLPSGLDVFTFSPNFIPTWSEKKPSGPGSRMWFCGLTRCLLGQRREPLASVTESRVQRGARVTLGSGIYSLKIYLHGHLLTCKSTRRIFDGLSAVKRPPLWQHRLILKSNWQHKSSYGPNFASFLLNVYFFYITEGDINLFSCNNNLGISTWLVSWHKVEYQWLAEKLTTNSILVSSFFKIHEQNI